MPWCSLLVDHSLTFKNAFVAIARPLQTSSVQHAYIFPDSRPPHPPFLDARGGYKDSSYIKANLPVLM
jgi:hypothetical protein